jgi:hypothetical protein
LFLFECAASHLSVHLPSFSLFFGHILYQIEERDLHVANIRQLLQSEQDARVKMQEDVAGLQRKSHVCFICLHRDGDVYAAVRVHSAQLETALQVT